MDVPKQVQCWTYQADISVSVTFSGVQYCGYVQGRYNIDWPSGSWDVACSYAW